MTDASGEVRFDYGSEKFVDSDDRIRGVFPDLYMVAYGPGGEKVITTRDETVRSTGGYDRTTDARMLGARAHVQQRGWQASPPRVRALS